MSNKRKTVEQRDIEVRNDAGTGDAKLATAWVQGRAAQLSVEAIQQGTNLTKRGILKMNKDFAEEVATQVRANLGEVAVAALQNMVDLAFNAENEHVKYVATKDLLDRAGFSPKKQVEVKQEVSYKDPKEIEREAREKFGDELAERLLSLRPSVVDGEYEMEKKDEGS